MMDRMRTSPSGELDIIAYKARGRRAGGGPSDGENTADQILRWLPVVAAARLSEGVTDEVSKLLPLARANA